MHPIPKILLISFAFVTGACAQKSETTTTEKVEAAAPTASVETAATENSVASTSSEKVEITLSDNLDGILNGYCIDIAGGNENVDIKKGLQGHTCYSYRGSLGSDQTFERGRFSQNQLYMSDFDVCATLSSLEAGAKVGLATCDNSDLQNFSFSGEGKITVTAAPTMCLTLASDTRFGKGSQHQIKALSLAACSDAQSAYQTWRVRSKDD